MGDVQHGLRDFSIVIQIGPTAGKPDQDAAGAGNDFGGHFDQAGLPCRGMSFAERILLATLVEVTAALIAGQCFGGNLWVLFCRRWIGHGTPQSHQQVVGGTVQVESKQIGQIPVVAEPIGVQSALEFLVAIFTFPALDVCVVSGLRKNRCTGTVGHNRPTVCSLRVRFALDECITCA